MTTFTQRELEISNKSYTNKDFESVYLELLSIAEKISTRFSPTSANEADPFIILLKLVAAVTDKINYNVDKNILERFLLSCTQEQSMRQLTQALGYNMRSYRSAETTVVFKVNFNSIDAEQAEGDDPIDEIDIPIYSIVTDGDSIQYITLEGTTIPRSSGISKEIPVIQGKLKELSILGKNVIQLENLDSNNRIYLPELMVAENGISINLASLAETWQAWTASTNLNTETFGSLVYQAGFDSAKNLPYIEFPEWIADIIGDGLSIKYVITDGAAGNVAARALTTVSRTGASVKIDDNLISVVNSSAATSGSEPETLDEAYKGFKKIIGTFDTLVTCRDYANKIYSLLDRYGNPFVSNIQVGDRRSDINYATDVVSATRYGMQTASSIGYKYDIMLDSATFNLKKDDLNNFELNKIYYIYDINAYYQCREISKGRSEAERMLLMLDETELEPVISPSDICLYPLNPITNFTYVAVDDINGYNQSYNILRNESQLENIQYNLNNSKTMSHTFMDIPGSSIGYIRNDYRLDATVNTIQKVNAFEQSEILVNINNALIQKYNPRTLSFGSEIAFDELLATIEKADSRIKSVSLQEPDQSPVIVKMNNEISELTDSEGNASDSFKFIVAKNILAGKVEVFRYDTEFEYNYVQKGARKYTDIARVNTYVDMPAFAKSAETEYTLNENEVVQFLAPLLKTEITYPYGINYYLYLASGADFIPKDTEYRLASGDLLIFSYVDNNDETVITVYDGSVDSQYIFKPNFDFYTTASRERDGDTPTKVGVKNSTYTYENYSFYTLMTNHTVECKKILSDKLTTPKRCYWLTNQPHNRILWDQEYEDSVPTGYFNYILGDGEYFFYADTALTSLFAFGAGTKLKIYAANPAQIIDQNGSSIWVHDNYVDINQITENGLTSLAAYFAARNFDANYLNLEIFENEIITLTSGDTLTITNNSADKDFTISNNVFLNIPETINVKYKFKGVEDESYSDLSDRSTLVSADAGWKCRAVLDLNCGPDREQILVNNQRIEFVPGTFDEQSRRWVAFTDIHKDFTGGNIELSALDQSEGELTKFKSNVSITAGGGEGISLEYMDLDLQYKCPSILVFKDVTSNSKISNIGDDYYTINFGTDATVQVIPVEPQADSTLTIVDANRVGAAREHNRYTDAKYFVTGTISEIVEASYGNLYIKDAKNNTLYIYGTYNADGTVRFDAMDPQPEIGDVITVYGKLGNYNGVAQMKTGWISAINPDEPDEPVEPDEPDVPTFTGDEVTLNVGATSGTSGQVRITSIIVDYRQITEDGQYEPAVDTPASSVTVDIAAYASAKAWEKGTKYTEVDLLVDADTGLRSIYAVANSPTYRYTGSYYPATSSQPRDQWRLYQSDEGSITIKSENNYIIDRVIINYDKSGSGTLLHDTIQINSGTEVKVHVYPQPDEPTEPDVPVEPDEPVEPETPDVPEDIDLRNIYKAKNLAVLYTAAADAENVVTKALTGANLPSLTFSAINTESVSKYFNNKIYRKIKSSETSPAGWYKCIYAEKNNTTSNNHDIHDPLDINEHEFRWNCEASEVNTEVIKPSPRILMIYLDNLDGKDDNILNVEIIQKKVFIKAKGGQIGGNNGLRVLNSLDDGIYERIELHEGLNIIEVLDEIEESGAQYKIYENYVEEVELEAVAEIKGTATEEELKTLTEEVFMEGAKKALTSISVLISKLKLKKGLNPILGLSDNDDIINYLKQYFYKQFNEFFINAEFEQAKLIDVSDDYPLSSAHAFYDVNNIANQWTLAKIDFPSSSIRIARTSKK